MADAYGLDDLSLLTSPQQDVARTIKTAFDNSAARYRRDAARMPMLAPSSQQATAYLQDQALARASATSNILNQNQQIQNLIDASHATPHGVGANLAAYFPYLNSLPGLSQLLFGSGAANDISKGGLLGAGKSAITWMYDAITGKKIAVDSTGKIVNNGALATDENAPPPTDGSWNPAAAAVPGNYTDWGTGGMDNPTPTQDDFGSSVVTAPYDPGVVSDQVPAFNWEWES